MRFTIDRIALTVSITNRPLFQDGQPCRAKINLRDRRIYLSDQLPTCDRRRALLHELRHAWVMTRGEAIGAEADADQAAEMMDVLMQQYEAQGGNEALESMRPEESRTPQQTPLISGPLANTWAQCGGCNIRVAVGSIANGKPEYNASVTAFLMDRSMCCPACEKITAWREVCSEEGMPLGAIVAYPAPRVLRGEEVGKWFQAHGELCNVTVLV